MEVFRLAGYSTWTGEATGSNPVFYTKWSVSLNGSGCQAFYLKIPVRIWYRLQTLET